MESDFRPALSTQRFPDIFHKKAGGDSVLPIPSPEGTQNRNLLFSLTLHCDLGRNMRDDGNIEIESSHKGSYSSSKVESSSDTSYYKGDLLTVRRLMSNLVHEDGNS
ncbi:hypothetical protein CR513_02665, partial [Mucuna pruriens]